MNITEKNIEHKKHNNNDTKNVPLFLFDLILLPVHLIRMIFIYFWGSKYNLKGFQFLDVIMHADNPYFNQDDCRIVNTIGNDYRIKIRDDSRFFPCDLMRHVDITNSTDSNEPYLKNNVTIGSTNTLWDIDTEEFDAEHNKNERQKINVTIHKTNTDKNYDKNHINGSIEQSSDQLLVDKSDLDQSLVDKSDNESSDSDTNIETGDIDIGCSSSDDTTILNNTTDDLTDKKKENVIGVNFFDDDRKKFNSKLPFDLFDSMKDEIDSIFGNNTEK